jgi:hypothetical protein
MESKMRKDIKKIWVNDLRSGNFTQADSVLCECPSVNDKKNQHHCCLGVLCDIYARKVKKKRLINVLNKVKKEGEYELLNDEVLKWAGLKDKTQQKLAEMNDDGDSFEEIASYISKNL